MSSNGATKGLSSVACTSLLALIFYSHFSPRAKVGGDATGIGMFFNVGGFESSIAMEKGMGWSYLVGCMVKGVKGGLSLSLLNLSSIMGSELKFIRFLSTLSIEVSSFKGKG